MNDLK
jgi:hypothetical protein